MINKRLFSNKNVALKKCKHGYFLYYINDLFIGRSLDLYGEWTENEFISLESLIFPGNTVVDVGAYIGTHSVFFGQKVGPSGWVYSLEPQRNIYNLLCANVAINNLLNVKCINAAASDKKSSARMPILDPNAQQNFGAIGIDRFEEGELVDVVTLDSLQLPSCNLIKIDVEGLQAKVLTGAKSTITRHRPILYVENNTTDHSKVTLVVLKELKYKSYWHILPYFNQNNFFGNSENVFERYQPEVNLLCFPQEAKVKVNGFIPVVGIGDNWQRALERLKMSQR